MLSEEMLRQQQLAGCEPHLASLLYTLARVFIALGLELVRLFARGFQSVFSCCRCLSLLVS